MDTLPTNLWSLIRSEEDWISRTEFGFKVQELVHYDDHLEEASSSSSTDEETMTLTDSSVTSPAEMSYDMTSQFELSYAMTPSFEMTSTTCNSSDSTTTTSEAMEVTLERSPAKKPAKKSPLPPKACKRYDKQPKANKHKKEDVSHSSTAAPPSVIENIATTSTPLPIRDFMDMVGYAKTEPLSEDSPALKALSLAELPMFELSKMALRVCVRRSRMTPQDSQYTSFRNQSSSIVSFTLYGTYEHVMAVRKFKPRVLTDASLFETLLQRGHPTNELIFFAQLRGLTDPIVTIKPTKLGPQVFSSQVELTPDDPYRSCATKHLDNSYEIYACSWTYSLGVTNAKVVNFLGLRCSIFDVTAMYRSPEEAQVTFGAQLVPLNVQKIAMKGKTVSSTLAAYMGTQSNDNDMDVDNNNEMDADDDSLAAYIHPLPPVPRDDQLPRVEISAPRQSWGDQWMTDYFSRLLAKYAGVTKCVDHQILLSLLIRPYFYMTEVGGILCGAPRAAEAIPRPHALLRQYHRFLGPSSTAAPQYQHIHELAQGLLPLPLPSDSHDDNDRGKTDDECNETTSNESTTSTPSSLAQPLLIDTQSEPGFEYEDSSFYSLTQGFEYIESYFESHPNPFPEEIPSFPFAIHTQYEYDNQFNSGNQETFTNSDGASHLLTIGATLQANTFLPSHYHECDYFEATNDSQEGYQQPPTANQFVVPNPSNAFLWSYHARN